jgi:hypothetical protein
MRVSPLAPLAVIATAAALAVGAQAATRMATDPAGDSRTGHADLRSGTARLLNGRLVFAFTAAQPFDDAHAPCLLLDTRGTHADEYRLCGDRAIRALRGGHARKIADASLQRRDDRTVVYRFRWRVVGRPLRFGWAAIVRDRSCPHRRCDRMPDGARRHYGQRVQKHPPD